MVAEEVDQDAPLEGLSATSQAVLLGCGEINVLC